MNVDSRSSCNARRTFANRGEGSWSEAKDMGFFIMCITEEML